MSEFSDFADAEANMRNRLATEFYTSNQNSTFYIKSSVVLYVMDRNLNKPILI